MAEEAIVTPEAEVNAPTDTTSDTKVEGTMEEVIQKEETKIEPKVVPEAAFLELKSELKALKKEMKEASNSEKKQIISEGIVDLTSKYPDVSPEFIQDMLSSATSVATKKIEEKYSPIIEKQENEKKQMAIDKGFNNLYEQALKDNPDLPANIDKELIKTLAFTPKYINTPIADILTKIYPVEKVGKSSSEDNVRSGAERVDDVVNFDNITDNQKKAIMEDPKARTKYFNWLDTQVGR